MTDALALLTRTLSSIGEESDATHAFRCVVYWHKLDVQLTLACSDDGGATNDSSIEQSIDAIVRLSSGTAQRMW